MTDPTFEPKQVQGNSFFYSNSAENSDKEYHIQINQVGEQAYTVDFQYGKRGSKLVHGTKNKVHMSIWSATIIFDEMVRDRIAKNYEVIALDKLESIYGVLVQNGMDASGVDLYMHIRGKTISMADYARQAGSSARAMYPRITSYSAARAVAGVMSEMLGVRTDPAVVNSVGDRVKSLLLEHGLDRVGIFLGITKGDQVVEWSAHPAHPAPSSHSAKPEALALKRSKSRP